jgi:hypothetical protein
MAKEKGQAGASVNEYRGIALPAGMTPACLDAVARIINLHQREECDDLDVECAVKVFKAVRSFLT